MLLLNGDCLELMKDIPEKSIDLILCDLPYGTTACKWDNIIPFEPLWEQYERVAKDNAAIVLFSTQPFTTILIHSNLKRYKYCWYWKKPYTTGFCFAKYQPMRCIEDICVFYKKTPKYNPQGLRKLEKPKERRGNRHDGSVYSKALSKEYVQRYTNYPKHLLEYGKDKKELHPTQKPVLLLEYLIKTYTDENDTVLDNCMGSGSTGVASVNTKRKFVGIELDKHYYDIASERINEAIAGVA